MPVILSRMLARARASEGFSMILVLSVALTVGLLLAAAFSAVNGAIGLSKTSTNHSQAYDAALAGAQEYDYQLESNPDYWESCAGPSGELEGPGGEKDSAYYEVKVLAASTSTESACNASSPFGSAIQKEGALANTFRIESTGCAGVAQLTSCAGSGSAKLRKISIIATFKVSGFLNYAYFTEHEDADPSLYDHGANQVECEKFATSYPRGGNCITIEFAPEDSVNGPMHTDDAAAICGAVKFGDEGETPPDKVEIYRSTYVAPGCSEGDDATYYTATGSPETGEFIEMPESDRSLKLYVEPVNLLSGDTHLTLNDPSAGKIAVENYKKETSYMDWPSNGLIYVQKQESATCSFEYEQLASDTSTELADEQGCGTVYVKGTYSRPLTIAAERELIIDGNVMPEGVSETTPMSTPPGTATLGLIATGFVRIYHPVGAGTNEWEHLDGTWTAKCVAQNEPKDDLTNPYIYAAILSTDHSFAVDNYGCGKGLGDLNIYGAIAQKYRGIVGEAGGAGYIKDYNYDRRLATDEPPYFLAPLHAGWAIVGETAKAEG